MKRFVVAVAVCGTCLAVALPAPAQDPVPQSPPTGTELVFEREVFSYPSFTRRNPFLPLEGTAGGPRYEQLTLIGIMFSPDPAASVAVISTGSVSVAADGTTSGVAGDAYYLKVGQIIGNATIIEIRRDAVVVDVEVFDAVQRKTMSFVSSRDGGTS
ncbi:MAG: hypothetical protein P8L45_03720 [Longimicrobiales bacterium]|nr:hypothetical protein [Longimicrobiales bacterium]